MAKFQYRMQNVLRVKEKLEEQAKLEFAFAQAALHTEEEKLNALNKRKEQYMDDGKKMRTHAIHVSMLRENELAIASMDRFLEEQSKEVQKAELVLERAKDKLILVMRERKTHEILKKSEFEKFKKEVQAKENVEIDELVSYVYGKKGDLDGGTR